MHYQNRAHCAYLTALALLFSYAEAFIPAVFPFFKPGLGNAAVLSALEMRFPVYAAVLLAKSVISAAVSGTLFSPFIIVSLCQSFCSGAVMFALGKLRHFPISVYGISVLGAAASSFAQIVAASLFTGTELFIFLGPMLLFACFSGILTAYSSTLITIPHSFSAEQPETIPERTQIRLRNVFPPIAAALSVVMVLCLKKPRFLAAAFALSLAFKAVSGKKIRLLPYLGLLALILIPHILVPSGKIILKTPFCSVTDGAVMLGMTKFLRLAAAISVSQCVRFNFAPDKSSFLALTMHFFHGFIQKFNETSGGIIQKMRAVLSCGGIPVEERTAGERTQQTQPEQTILFAAALLIFAAMLVLEHHSSAISTLLKS